jgi:hypothetical protein
MSTKKTAWADQQDKKLVSAHDPDEVGKVVRRMKKKEGIIVSYDEVRALIKEFGDSRKRLYKLIREKHAQPEVPAQGG